MIRFAAIMAVAMLPITGGCHPSHGTVATTQYNVESDRQSHNLNVDGATPTPCDTPKNGEERC